MINDQQDRKTPDRIPIWNPARSHLLASIGRRSAAASVASGDVIDPDAGIGAEPARALADERNISRLDSGGIVSLAGEMAPGSDDETPIPEQ